MNLQTLLHNKTVLYSGGALAGGAGLYLLVKMRKGASSSASSGDAAVPGTTVPGGFPDTSGTDIAAVVGQQIGPLQGQLTDITSTLGDIDTTLGNLQPTMPPGHGTPAPPITTHPPGAPVKTATPGLWLTTTQAHLAHVAHITTGSGHAAAEAAYINSLDAHQKHVIHLANR